MSHPASTPMAIERTLRIMKEEHSTKKYIYWRH